MRNETGLQKKSNLSISFPFILLSLILLGLLTLHNESYAETLNDYNPYNVNIPDNGSSVNSDLSLSGAPSGAVITKVKIYYEIRHTYPRDLDVWLTAYYDGGWHDYYLYHQGDLGSSDDIVETRDNLHHWDGASPNQTWYLCVQDRVSGDVGYIDFFELWVDYSYNDAPNAPINENPYDGQSNVSSTTDLNWSCSDPDGDTVYYTVCLEKNDSSPDNIIKNDSTGSYADPGTLDYNSHYYWQVKADDHKGGETWGPVWDFYTEADSVVDGEITGVSFNKTQVNRGQETITATVSIRNTGNQNWTFYVSGSSIKQGDTTWYDWSPARASKTLSPGQTGTVNVSWSPSASVPTGTYGFFSKVFKYSTGDEYVDDNWRDGVFQIVEAVLLSSGRIAFHRDSDNHSLHTPINGDDGNIFVCNLNTASVSKKSGGLSIGNCMNPHFSPDGSALTFMAIPSGQVLSWSNMRVYVLDLAEGALTNLGTGQDPKFSADGQMVVYKKSEQIWQMNRDGSSDLALTTSAGEKSGPNYNPVLGDGRITYWKTYWVGSSKRGDICLRLSNGTEQTLVSGTDLRYCYYPIWRDSNRILYTISEGDDDLNQFTVSTSSNSALPSPINSSSDDSDPFPANDLIGFSSSRIESTGGGYDLYIAKVDGSSAQELLQANTSLHELGGFFSPYRYARKIKVSAPSSGASLQASSSYLLKVRAYSDGAIWAGANPSVTLSGPVTQTYSGLKDDGTGGDQSAGDGIYSKTVTLPSTSGAYTVTASVISTDNGLENHIQSNSIEISLTNSLPEITVTPSSFDFGSVEVGDYLEKVFTVENTGYETLEGSASTSAPFTIHSGGSYSLTHRQTQTVTVQFSPTEEGSFNKNVTFTGGGGVTRPVSGEGTEIVDAPVIASISDHTIQEGSSYTGPTPTLTAGTQPITYSLITYPNGMVIDPETGVVSWQNPTVAGSPHTITIRATNTAGYDDENWQLTVVPTGVCTYFISPTSEHFSSSEWTGSVSVTTESGCDWTATSNDVWITLTSGSSGSGNGTVSYSVSSNSSTGSRTGTMTIAGNTFTVTQEGINIPPTANAGSDQTVEEGGTVTLDGSNSTDPDDGIASYLWAQTGGTSVTLSDINVVQPTFIAPNVGPDGESLTFQLTVTDNGGLQDTETCIVNVTWENNPPTADAGPDQTVDEGVIVTLDGSNSSDPDNSIASYLWEQTGGISVALSDTTAVQPTFTAPDVGPDGESLTFQLTVTDSGGLQSTDSCIVNITGDNDPPNADAGPDQTVDEGETVTLDGSNSTDPDDGIASYLWTQTAGTPATLSDPTAVQPTFTSPNLGSDGESLTFQLTVTDNGGLQDTETCIVNVTWENNPPTADAGPDQTVDEGVIVTLDGSNSSDPDNSIASYLWEQTGGISVALSDTTAVQPTFTAPDVGPDGESLTFQLTVTDSGGLQSTDSCIVNVTWQNIPPTANAGPDQTVEEGVTVTLDGASSTDPDDSIASYLWEQIGGPPVTLSDTAAVGPTFVTPPVDPSGVTLTFQLTVMDNGGLQATDEVSITINDNGITGFPDDVVTMTCTTGKSIGVKVATGGNCVNIGTNDPVTITDTTNRPENLIYGLVDIQLKVNTAGATATVTIYLPTPVPDGYGWYKYSAANGWTDYSANGVFNATRDQVTLTLVDGGIGDTDGVANGLIVDPSGLGTPTTPEPTPTPAPNGGGGGGGGCSIATAAFGSSMEKHVTILKDFRDNYLLPSTMGRMFVNTYYKYSPPVAHFIEKHETLRGLVRMGLMPLVVISYSTIHFGPVTTLTMLVVLFILPVCLVAFYRRKTRSRRATN